MSNISKKEERHKLNIEIGARCKQARITAGYTQEQLSEKLGVSRQAVSRWELGETTPEMNILIQLCKVFDVSADYFLGITENY